FFESTAADNSEPALNFATVFAAILIVFLVCGLIPFLALLSEVEKVPKPTKEILSPFFKAAVTLSVNESKAFFAAALVMPASAAIASINSDLFIILKILMILRCTNIAESRIHASFGQKI